MLAELAPYATAKGTLKFPYDQPLPLKLIAKLVRNRVKDDWAYAKAKGCKRGRSLVRQTQRHSESAKTFSGLWPMLG